MTPLEKLSPLRHRSRPLRHCVAVALAAAVIGAAGPAAALPEFPGIVFDTLKLSCVPPCTICHLMPVPEPGASAEQPFADNLRAMAETEGPGVQPNEQNLAGILTKLRTQPCPNTMDRSCASMPCGPCNADGQGEPDILEIEGNQNPNNSSALPCVEYGCFARVAPKPPRRTLDGTAALAALGVAIVLAGRWRRRSRR
jgi:hypothetical protein